MSQKVRTHLGLKYIHDKKGGIIPCPYTDVVVIPCDFDLFKIVYRTVIIGQALDGGSDMRCLPSVDVNFLRIFGNIIITAGCCQV
jgi:hypothetical protein